MLMMISRVVIMAMLRFRIMMMLSVILMAV